jgi:hypothetical protein
VEKKFLTSISVCYVQEKNPFIFSSQICLFQTFYSHIYPQNVQFFYMPIQMEFKQKYFNCLLLLRFYIIHKSKIFRIKKTAAFCVFCGLRYSSDNLLSFDTNALYFVRPLYTHIYIYLYISSYIYNTLYPHIHHYPFLFLSPSLLIS